MNDVKKGVWIGVAIAIVLSIVAIAKPAPEKVIEKTTIEKPALGALAGPDIPFGWLSFGGVRRSAQRQGFLSYESATTTACDFTSPAATSSIISAIGIVTDATSTAIQFEWGKSANPAATTTSLGKYSLASGAWAVMPASTTAFAVGGTGGIGADPAYVLAPSQHLTLKWGGAVPAINALDGYCNATFEELVY